MQRITIDLPLAQEQTSPTQNKEKENIVWKVIELQKLVEESRENMYGAGRKKLQINEQVYPLLKEEMLKIARLGGD